MGLSVIILARCANHNANALQTACKITSQDRKDPPMPFDPSLIPFWLKKTVSLMLLPPSGPLLLIVAGLWLLHRQRRRIGLSLAWGGVLMSLVLSSPLTVSLMLMALEPDLPVTPAELLRAEAIVILGGGKRSRAPEYGNETLGETVNRLTLERVRYGARLARESGLPVLVTGGAVYGHSSEADLMQAALEIDFNIPVHWAERSARDTRENARFSAMHLKAAGVQRIALVTHAVHMPRARAEFEAEGFEVIAAPTSWLGTGNPLASGELPDLLPTANSAYAGWLASHELLGRLAYRLSR